MVRRVGRSGLKDVPLSETKDNLSRSLEHDPRFLSRVEQARSSLSAGLGIKLEDIEQE